MVIRDGVGVAGYCELPNVSAGNQPWVILGEKQVCFTSGSLALRSAFFKIQKLGKILILINVLQF